MMVFAHINAGVVEKLYWAELPENGDIPVTGSCREGWTFDGTNFIQPPAEAQAEKDAKLNNNLSDKLTKLLFEINFDQENRLRTLQGQGTITRNQYLNALKTVWSSL